MRQMLGFVAFCVWITGVLSQPVFSVGGSPRGYECASVLLLFWGGIAPYNIYYSVAQRSDNYVTWSEESLLIGYDEVYNLFVSPDIGVSIQYP
jgi:hypothetical protein